MGVLDRVARRGVEARALSPIPVDSTRVNPLPPTPRADAPPRSPGGRRLVAATATVITSAFVAHAALAVYHGTFTVDAPAPSGVTCGEGIRRLHDGYARVWEARREGRAAPFTEGLDRELRGLRGVCEAEGARGAEAWRHLERWRYRAESMAHLWRDTLDADAQRALAHPLSGTSR